MNTEKNTSNDNPLASSPLDDMLREWHEQNTEAARTSRDNLTARLAEESEGNAPIAHIGVSSSEKDALTFRPAKRRMTFTQWALPMAAVIALVGAAAIWFGPMQNVPPENPGLSGLALHDGVYREAIDVAEDSQSLGSQPDQEATRRVLQLREEVLANAESIRAKAILHKAKYTPVAGRLDALNDEGETLGDCALEHTEVGVNIAGRFARVSLTQHFYNTFDDKIEAVYTFPMSQDAAVDAMKITVGERVIEAEIEERQRARQIYEAARQRGHVAALLEQERPNIFTQSVANIEPGARVSVHITYTELVSETDGKRSFDFPMVVAPRYIPGPATGGGPPIPGSDAPPPARPGEPFAEPTNQVPDADKITPMPNHPDVRAGHDISINVTINTGGPALLGIDSASHKINITNDSHDFDQPRTRAKLSLASFTEIPNKDFVLTWRQDSEFIEPTVFTHSNELGSFVTMVLEPPARVDDAIATPKELVFVLDSSGSMNGQPIEKAKQVIDESLQALRPQDTFNIVTFAGTTRVLWDSPMPGTPANIAAAREFVSEQQGAGGTEMMHAINTALIQRDDAFKHTLTIEDLASTPADGRRVIVRIPFGSPRETDPESGVVTLHLPNGRSIETSEWIWQNNEQIFCPTGVPVFLSGRWVIEDSRRILRIEAARYAEPPRPLRIVAFLTDGLVGNDQAIIAAVQRNARTTRVFSFGVGSSPNRYLLDAMAKASKGEVEYVGLEADATEKASKFAQRISTPVLRDVTLTIPSGLAAAELSSPDLIAEPRLVRTNPNGDKVYELPDLFDVKPITIHARLDDHGAGTPVFRGFSPLGEYRATLSVPVVMPEAQPQLPTLWARAEVEHVMNQDLQAAQQGSSPPALRERVVELGKAYSIMTQYTSFVAVDRTRVTLGGQPRLVRVPIEMPEGMNYWKIFSRMPRPTQEWLQPSMSQTAGLTQLPAGEEDGAVAVHHADNASLIINEAEEGIVRALRDEWDDGSWSTQSLASMPTRNSRRQDLDYRLGRSATAGGRVNQMKAAPTVGLSVDAVDQEKEESSEPGFTSPSPRYEARTRERADSAEDSLSEDLYPSRKRVRLFVTKVDLGLLNEIASGERGSPIRVSILMSDITEDTLRALSDAGAEIEGKSESVSIVIASVMPGGFDALVELDAVLRIEPASIKPDA